MNTNKLNRIRESRRMKRNVNSNANSNRIKVSSKISNKMMTEVLGGGSERTTTISDKHSGDSFLEKIKRLIHQIKNPI